jgi:hypothetical protein
MKKVRSLLNGGAAAAGVDGLQAAISSIEGELAAFRREVAEIPRRCGEAALADDGVAQTQALRARESELYAALEVGENQLARLREKLTELINIKRRDRIAYHRAEARKAFEALVVALASAVEANEATGAVYEAAARELGGADAGRLIGRFTFLLGGFVRELVVERWPAETRRELEAAAGLAPLAPSSLPQQPAGATRPFGAGDLELIGRPKPRPTDSLQHGLRLYDIPGGPKHSPPAKTVAVAQGQFRTKRSPRAPLPETPPIGTVRCVVRRDGYQDPVLGGPEGSLLNGDLVDVEKAAARSAVENGALEFANADDNEVSR